MLVNEIALNTVVKVKEVSTSLLNKVADKFSGVAFLQRNRKMLIGVSVCWLLVIVAGYAVYRTSVSNATDAFYSSGVNTVQALAEDCGPFILENDILALSVQIREIEKLPNLELAAVVDHKGEILTQTGSETLSAPFDPLQDRKVIDQKGAVWITQDPSADDTGRIGFSAGITFADVQVGHAYLALSAERLYVGISRWRWSYAAVVGLATLMAAGIIFWSDRRTREKKRKIQAELESQDRIGPYQLVRKVARGGMAELYLADYLREDGFRKKVALKRILPHLSENPEFIQMFIREARVAALLQHPNIVQIFDYGRIDHAYFIAMEYIDGKNLAEVLAAKENGLEVEPAVFIISRVCKGLVYSHSRKSDDTGEPMSIIHRDITPQNLLISYEGEVKISDFGISKTRSEPSLTQAGVIKGKMAYLAPEQTLGEAADHRADIYALGLVFHETLTGQRVYQFNSDVEALREIPRFEIPSVRSLIPAVPEELDRIVMKCLVKDREARYQDAAEMYGDLTAFRKNFNLVFDASDLADFMNRLFDQVAR
jgi:tRNA A-37 threonylcarbamoyl transferase component Bud32